MKAEKSVPAGKVNEFRRYARAVIEHHLGSGAHRIVFKSSGFSNFVFSVTHAHGDFIVRISPNPASISSFIKEQWAQSAARRVGIPTPEILEVGSEIIPHPYMIARSVEGHHASDNPNRTAIVREVGRYAALINSIPTMGFGETFDWSENQLSLNATFKEYLQKEYRFEAKLEILAKHDAISAQQKKKLQKIFHEAMKMTPKSVLNHGDIRLKNVIADKDGKINAIIDWENCTSNVAPQWELSLALHDLGIDGMQHFLEGYGINNKKLREIMPMVKAFNVANYAAAIEKLAKVRDELRLGQYRTRLSGALDLYSFCD